MIPKTGQGCRSFFIVVFSFLNNFMLTFHSYISWKHQQIRRSLFVGGYIYETLVRNWLIENIHLQLEIIAQLKFTCSKSTIETIGKCVKYIQSYQ